MEKNKLVVQNSFRQKLQKGACFALALATVAGLTGKAHATLENTNNQTEIVTLQNLLKEIQLDISRGVNIYINDKSFMPTDVDGNEVYPFIYNGTTYLPARAISTTLGAKIDWDGQTKSVYIDTNSSTGINKNFKNKSDTTIQNSKVIAYTGAKIYVNNKLFTPTDVSGNKVETYIINGTTYLPVRAISNALNIAVQWDAAKKRVYLGEHKVIENPTGEYIRKSDPRYAVPGQNQSNEELAARLILTYNEWTKYRELATTKSKYMGSFAREYIEYYNEYVDYIDHGYFTAEKYEDAHMRISYQLEDIGSQLDAAFSATADDIYKATGKDVEQSKINPGSISKNMYIVSIINADNSIEKIMAAIEKFGPEQERYYRNQFKQIYTDFVNEFKVTMQSMNYDYDLNEFIIEESQTYVKTK